MIPSPVVEAVRRAGRLCWLVALASAVSAASRNQPDVIVAADGSGKYQTVREAIDAAPQITHPGSHWTILVKPGTYRELIYVQTIFLHTEMSDVVQPAGWNNWGKPYAEKVARYAEFASTGPGAKPAERARWSRQLTADEAARYSVEKVLGGADGWNPTKP